MAIIHNTDLTITQMVYNRLPYLADTPNNAVLVSNFILEVMYELEVCFLVDEDLPEDQDTHVGNEGYYSIVQRSIIADVVAVYILMVRMLGNMAGTVIDGVETPAISGKELSKVNAGSVGVEWSRFDLTKNAGLFTTGDRMLELYKKAAMRKARTLGCIIDICEDCSTAAELLLAPPDLHLFKVSVQACGSFKPPEQG